MDDTVKNFLGVTHEKDIQVIEGQKVNDKKLAQVQDEYLLHEACEYGDALVRYVINHLKLTNEQRAWATSLGMFCLRAEYPEGVDTFDDLMLDGGNDLILEKESEDTEEVRANTKKEALQDEEVLEEAGKFAELFAKYTANLKKNLGVSNPQAVYGLGRAWYTLRRAFPEESGGPAGFDYWASQAGDYFHNR